MYFYLIVLCVMMRVLALVQQPEADSRNHRKLKGLVSLETFGSVVSGSRLVIHHDLS